MRFRGEAAAKTLLQYVEHIDSKPQCVKEERQLSTGMYHVWFSLVILMFVLLASLYVLPPACCYTPSRLVKQHLFSFELPTLTLRQFKKKIYKDSFSLKKGTIELQCLSSDIFSIHSVLVWILLSFAGIYDNRCH